MKSFYFHLFSIKSKPKAIYFSRQHKKILAQSKNSFKIYLFQIQNKHNLPKTLIYSLFINLNSKKLSLLKPLILI
jgi:hypothetical protein